MKVIACNVAMFGLHQEVYLIDDSNKNLIAVSNTDDLGSDIAMMCEKYDVDDVHLFGNEQYLQHAITDLKNANITKYGNRNLNIEVN